MDPQIPMKTVFRNGSTNAVTVRIDHVDFEMWKGEHKVLMPGDTLSIPTAYAQDSLVVLILVQ